MVDPCDISKRIWTDGPYTPCPALCLFLLNAKKDAWFTIYCSMRLYAVILILCCRPPGFTVESLGKCLAGGLQSGCTVKLTGAQYKLYLPSEEELLQELRREYQALENEKLEKTESTKLE